MKSTIFLSAVLLAGFASHGRAAVISLTAPVNTPTGIDVAVQASNLFTGRNAATDGVIAYGFNVNVSNPAFLSFLGATSGPLFDPATTEPGTNVFGAASGLGIFSPVSQPVTLATLHFLSNGFGAATVTLTSNLGNPFQGLQFLNSPVAESISGTFTVAAVSPEPATFGFAAVALAGLLFARTRRAR